MKTASEYMKRAVDLVEEGLDQSGNDERSRAWSQRQIAAARVYAELAKTAFGFEHMALMDSRLVGDALAPEQDPPSSSCTCSPDGSITHQVGCDHTEEDGS